MQDEVAKLMSIVHICFITALRYRREGIGRGGEAALAGYSFLLSGGGSNEAESN